jgi:ribosomal protein S3AE
MIYYKKGGVIMKIKTFPIQFTEDKLDELRAIAESENKSIKQLILDLIEKKIKEVKGE